MNALPKAKTENIVSQTIGTEILIHNIKTNMFFHLNETSSIVYLACNGETSLADLTTRHQLTDEVVFLALDGLRNEKLLADNADFPAPFAGMSRRQAIKKAGLSSLVALPIISSLVAPTAANAASGCLQQNQGDCRITPCCSNLVCSGGADFGTCTIGTV